MAEGEPAPPLGDRHEGHAVPPEPRDGDLEGAHEQRDEARDGLSNSEESAPESVELLADELARAGEVVGVDGDRGGEGLGQVGVGRWASRRRMGGGQRAGP